MCDDCKRLHEELHIQAHEMFLLRRNNCDLEKQTNRLRHEKMKLVKDMKKDQKLRYKNRNRKTKHKIFYGEQ